MPDGLRKYARVSSSQSANGHPCKTCALWPQTHKDIRDFVAAVDAGDPDFINLPVASEARWDSLMTYLAGKYGYDLGPTALRRHVNRCLRGQKQASK